MFSTLRKHKGKVPIIGELIFSLLTMPCAFSYLTEWSEDQSSAYLPFWICATYLMMGIAMVFQAFRLRRKGRVSFILDLIFGIVFIGCAVALAGMEYTPTLKMALGFTFWGMLLTGRILSIVRKHRWQNVILNIIAIFLILIYSLSLAMPEQDTIFVVMLVVGFRAMFAVMAVAFSRLRLDILKDVIRKTYAAEIVLGLLLFILACASVLRFTEDAITSYSDALWYCFAVVTTIGFGDITATTGTGRILSVVLGIYGIVVVALITSIIVNFYGEMKRTEPAEDAAKLADEPNEPDAADK